MIPNETILEVSATMIVGVLFVVTLVKAFGFLSKGVARIMLIFYAAGVVPFSLSAFLALSDINVFANIMCGFGFVTFAIILLVVVYASAKMEEEAYQ